MDHAISPKNQDDPRRKPKTPVGLGWAEFFQTLGQGTVLAEHRSPLPKLIQK